MRLAAVIAVAVSLAQVGPTYDVVSIKPNTTPPGPGPLPPLIQRPDGSFTFHNQPLTTFIARAYPGMAEMIGIPDWAKSERYDIATTSMLTMATADDRIAMMRAMLVDRFKLVAHVEQREVAVYDLILARKDGRLGKGLQKSDADCSMTPPPISARPDLTQPPPPCTLRSVGSTLRGDKQVALGDLVEGETTMAILAQGLSNFGARRPVVDKTGLPGTYRIRMNFDMRGTILPPGTDLPPSNAATLFTAVQEELGLKLEPSKAVRDVLVIERVERPTPN